MQGTESSLAKQPVFYILANLKSEDATSALSALASDLRRHVPEEGATTCCYSRSEKSWIRDPEGVQWETFLTTGESAIYGRDRTDKGG